MLGPRRSHRSRGLALGTQAVMALCLLLLLVVLVAMTASTYVLRRDLQQQYEQRALAIARGFAADQDLSVDVATLRPDRNGPVQQDAERVRRRTHALYVVVTDDQGIRFSHPTPSNVGKMVSTSPDRALEGQEVVTIQKGTLGYSARGKVPLRSSTGRVIGEVSVGIATSELDAQTRKLALLLALVSVAPLTLGVLGAVALARRLRRTTLGLEPGEMADLLREHAAVLGGIRDAVVAVDREGRVTVSNPEANRLVGRPLERGELIGSSGAAPGLADLFDEEPPPDGALRVVGGKVVVATRLVVRRDERDLGQVVIMRDRSDLDDLARELEATRSLTDALRAQAHEHTNRLHTLTGMLHHGALEDARGYLEELSATTTWVKGLDDPYLAGLLAAKAAAASEAGVTLVVSENTWVEGRLAYPLDAITVVGNLIDNGIRAAGEGGRSPRWVEVTLLSTGADLLAHVVDSGDGVPADIADHLFDHGFTTRDPDLRGHGIGLALARHTARGHGGDVALVDRGGSDQGATFEARMVDLMSAGRQRQERTTR